MVYTSIPSYLDPPPNWIQQQYQHQSHHEQQGANGAIITAGGVLESNQHLFQPPPPPPPPQEGGNSNSSIRPNSMVDRARQAKLPPPEQAVKCPRCDSTNTKFCYYNNYSLSQPRHFCKTCRRYWTRGGSLRNVPVGGGFRRNKRGGKSSSSSKSSASTTTTNKVNASNSSMAANLPDRGGTGNYGIISPPQNPFINSSLPEYGVFPSGSIGLNFNFAGIQSIGGGGGGPINYPIGGGDTGVDLNNWRHQQIQQFPSFTTRLDQQTTPGGLMYQLQEESDSGLISQRLNLPKQYLGMSTGNGQNLAGDAAGGGGGSSSSRGGVGWITTDLNGFN